MEDKVKSATPVALTAQEVRPLTTTTHHYTSSVTHDDSNAPISWLGNILWIWLGGGAVVAAVYFLFGVLLILTVILAPFGLQLIKIGEVALFPFGKRVTSCSASSAFEGILNSLLNILWLPVGVLLLAWHLVMGVLCACTCYGIIFSFQHLKLARMALFPFGSGEVHERIVSESFVTTTTTTTYDAIPHP